METMIYDLPRSVEFGGRAWEIATDFRDILRILLAFEDPDLSDAEKVMLCLYNLYVDVEEIPQEQLQAAYDAAIAFIDHGGSGDGGPRTMDWTQDAPLIFPAVNRAAGFEVRSVEYMHWWTFMGYFMEIKDTTYATVLGIRSKKGRGKKLEKWEKDYWNENRKVCELRARYTEEELRERERLKRILGG